MSYIKAINILIFTFLCIELSAQSAGNSAKRSRVGEEESEKRIKKLAQELSPKVIEKAQNTILKAEKLKASISLMRKTGKNEQEILSYLAELNRQAKIQLETYLDNHPTMKNEEKQRIRAFRRDYEERLIKRKTMIEARFKKRKS